MDAANNAALVAALQNDLNLPGLAAINADIALIRYDIDRIMSMNDNRAAGTSGRFTYIPARPGCPVLPQGSFPRNVEELVTLHAPEVAQCLASYNLVVVNPAGGNATIQQRRREIGKYIGVALP